MSGFEIAGIVLGVIPLALQAYDRYDKISKAIASIPQYPQELRKLDSCLNSQKIIFKHDAKKLLTALTRRQDEAESLLSERMGWDDLRWTVPVPIASREGDLRDAFNNCSEKAGMILVMIESACRRIESCRSEYMGSTKQASSVETFKLWIKAFKSSSEKKEIQGDITELRRFTRDFAEITSRIVELLKDTTLASHTSVPKAASDINNLQRYQQIRAALYNLYEAFALRWSCDIHQQHTANVAFKATSEGTKFVAVVSSAKGDRVPGTLWLEIEHFEKARSQRNDSVGFVTSADYPTHSASHARNSQTNQPVIDLQSQTTKILSFHASTRRCPDDQGEQAPEDSKGSLQAKRSSYQNLDQVNDYCLHFEANRSRCGAGCIGYLNHGGIHRFYLPDDGGVKTPMTLEEIIAWVSENEESRRLSRTITFHIASSLARAILQYHSTPWLPDRWISNDIQFFGPNLRTLCPVDLNFASPYFQIGFSKTGKGKTGVEPKNSSDGQMLSTAIARNEILFSFGIVLLELGYGRPWPVLRRRALQKLPANRQNDYHAACLLAREPELSRLMEGVVYPRVVKRCLGCDFGLGEDSLENEELQGAFLIHVVNELQQAEQHTRSFRGQVFGGI